MIDVEVEVKGGLGELAVTALDMLDTQSAGVTLLTVTRNDVMAVLARLAEAGLEVSGITGP